MVRRKQSCALHDAAQYLCHGALASASVSKEVPHHVVASHRSLAIVVCLQHDNILIECLLHIVKTSQLIELIHSIIDDGAVPRQQFLILFNLGHISLGYRHKVLTRDAIGRSRIKTVTDSRNNLCGKQSCYETAVAEVFILMAIGIDDILCQFLLCLRRYLILFFLHDEAANLQKLLRCVVIEVEHIGEA